MWQLRVSQNGDLPSTWLSRRLAFLGAWGEGEPKKALKALSSLPPSFHEALFRRRPPANDGVSIAFLQKPTWTPHWERYELGYGRNMFKDAWAEPCSSTVQLFGTWRSSPSFPRKPGRSPTFGCPLRETSKLHCSCQASARFFWLTGSFLAVPWAKPSVEEFAKYHPDLGACSEHLMAIQRLNFTGYKDKSFFASSQDQGDQHDSDSGASYFGRGSTPMVPFWGR